MPAATVRKLSDRNNSWTCIFVATMTPTLCPLPLCAPSAARPSHAGYEKGFGTCMLDILKMMFSNMFLFMYFIYFNRTPWPGTPRTVPDWKAAMERTVLRPREAVVAGRRRCAPGKMIVTVVSDWTLMVSNTLPAFKVLKEWGFFFIQGF